MGQVRHGSATSTHAVRAAIQRSIARQSLFTAMRGASFARAVEPGTRHQPEDGGEVAQAGDGRGHEDRAFGTEVHGPVRGRGSDGRSIPKAHAAAAG